MARYLGERILASLLVLFALSILTFSMVRLIPGDPATQYLDQSNPDPGQLEQIRAELGLDRPWLEQYVSWMGGVLTGDFGRSLTRPQEVGVQLLERFPVSFQLAVVAVILSILIGVPLGLIAATRQGSVIDVAIQSTSFVALAVPPFLIATLLILVDSNTTQVGLLGFTRFSQNPLGSILSTLPAAAVLASTVGATVARYTRGTVIDALSQDYIRTARSKGVSLPMIVLRHSMRNAMIPVVTIIGIQLGNVIGGTVIIEAIFAIPGLGSYLIESINSTDYPAIQGAVLVIGLTYIVINLVVDLLYPAIDPRIRAAA